MSGKVYVFPKQAIGQWDSGQVICPLVRDIRTEADYASLIRSLEWLSQIEVNNNEQVKAAQEAAHEH